MKLRVPALTVAIAAAALLIHVLPEPVTAELQFVRAGLAHGQWWRLFTGHLTHFGANHLAWDVAAFLTLGWCCESQSRTRTVLTLIVASPSIAIALWICQPQFEIYRGLSGLDCALFGMLATYLCRSRQCISKSIGVLALLGVGAKSGWEIATASPFFASGNDYAPVPLAHVIGLASGILGAVVPPWIISRPGSCSETPKPSHPGRSSLAPMR